MSLRDKHILIGISGGIAAYKVPYLIRILRKEGADVKVCCTHHALEFVTEPTLRTLSGHSVYCDVFAAINQHSTEHISLPDWADMMIVAPATANVIGKMACGIADDALTTTFAAMRKPVLIAPAMNTGMYESPATQHNMDLLRQWENIHVMESPEGELACGTSGKGRMAEPEQIAWEAERLLTPQTLKGRRILITAGPTIEKLDPVRYITNFSTGKMGRALADVCQLHGAEVILVSGQMSARQMLSRCEEEFPDCDTAILCAAVADYRPEHYSESKIKKIKSESDESHVATLPMVENPDIAATLGQRKTAAQKLIGFALETNDGEANALRKMERKNLDAIVLNSPTATTGFGTDTNAVTIYERSGQKTILPLASKQEIAQKIIETLL